MKNAVENLTKAIFAEHLGSTFRVEFEAGQSDVDVELVSVQSCSKSQADADRPFAIELRGPADTVWQQQIYKLQHPELGSLELFLVPVGADAQGMIYEAVFN